MPRYFFHVCRRQSRVVDHEGTDLPNLDAAKLEAIADARTFMSADIAEGIDRSRTSWIEVTDEQGRFLFDVPFREAVQAVDTETCT